MVQVKVLTVTDLHLKPLLYDQLAAAVALHQPDLVACVGDFLDRPDPRTYRYNYLTPEQAAKRLSALPCKDVVLVMGNHEPLGWDRFLAAWQAIGRPLNVLHGSLGTFGPLEIVGFPCAMGGVFEYAGVPRLTNKHPNSWLPHLLWNEGLAPQTLWLMHEPPVEALGDPKWAVNDHWREAIELYSPITVVCGHDHTWPIATEVWFTKIGQGTKCVNVGQTTAPIPGPLRYCLLTFEFPTNEPSLPSHPSVERFIWQSPDLIPF